MTNQFNPFSKLTNKILRFKRRKKNEKKKGKGKKMHHTSLSPGRPKAPNFVFIYFELII